jgi:hypothetical protein
MSRSAGRLGWPLTVVALVLAACKAPPPSPAPPQAGDRPPAAIAREAERQREALEAAIEAYIYGYPLVSAELARRVATNVDRPAGAQAPMGQLARGASPRASLDTLELGAWLDVAAEPVVLSLPDAKGRLVTITLRSAWHQRLDTIGGKGAKGKAGRVAITGPAWRGKLPAGIREVRSPTALVRRVGRVLAAGGPADRAEAQAWRDRATLLPLGANPRKYLPPPGRPDASLDVKSPVRDQVHALDAVVYFKLLATLLKANPPAAADAPLLPTLARIGLVPGKDYDPTGLDASIIKALAGVPELAQQKILAATGQAAMVNGWSVTGQAGERSGPLGRAADVAAGIDGLLDGVLLAAETDGAGAPLDGTAHRVLRFTRGKGPPADVLWTLTAVEPRGAAAAGASARGQLTSRNKFQYGRDGSLELLLQAQQPRGREANWLQVPAGPYALVLRLHGPRQRPPSVLDGSWKPPPVGTPR